VTGTGSGGRSRGWHAASVCRAATVQVVNGSGAKIATNPPLRSRTATHGQMRPTMASLRALPYQPPYTESRGRVPSGRGLALMRQVLHQAVRSPGARHVSTRRRPKPPWPTTPQRTWSSCLVLLERTPSLHRYRSVVCILEACLDAAAGNALTRATITRVTPKSRSAPPAASSQEGQTVGKR
jgi:hypothetical protein